MTPEYVEFNQDLDEYREEFNHFFTGESPTFDSLQRKAYGDMASIIYHIFHEGKAFKILYRDWKNSANQPFEKILAFVIQHISVWKEEKSLVLQSDSQLFQPTLSDDASLLIRWCAELWWIKLALESEQRLVQLWAQEGTTLFRKVFKGGDQSRFPKIGQLNACDFMKEMMKLKGFESQVKKYLEDLRNVYEIAQNIFSFDMWKILNKASLTYVIVPGPRDRPHFYAIHFSFWNIPRDDGQAGINKIYSQIETNILTEGLKHIGFVVQTIAISDEHGQPDANIIKEKLKEALKMLANGCWLFFISFSMHGVKGHFTLGNQRITIQSIVELVNRYLPYTAKVMANQTCRNVPDSKEVDWLNNVSHELKRCVREKTRNMMLMNAVEEGEMYEWQYSDTSYLMRIGYAMKNANKDSQLTAYRFHLEGHKRNRQRADNTVYYSFPKRDIAVPVRDTLPTSVAPSENN